MVYVIKYYKNDLTNEEKEQIRTHAKARFDLKTAMQFDKTFIYAYENVLSNYCVVYRTICDVDGFEELKLKDEDHLVGEIIVLYYPFENELIEDEFDVFYDSDNVDDLYVKGDESTKFTPNSKECSTVEDIFKFAVSLTHEYTPTLLHDLFGMDGDISEIIRSYSYNEIRERIKNYEMGKVPFVGDFISLNGFPDEIFIVTAVDRVAFHGIRINSGRVATFDKRTVSKVDINDIKSDELIELNKIIHELNENLS